jgi:Flp pilus assembly protein TadG
MKISLQIQKMPRARGQAIVEFALVLMILMVMLVGILEVGRLMFMYAAVNNASREAARYASAIGLDTNPDNGVTAEKYRFCEMIKKMAQRSAFFTTPTITISYDHGPTTTAFDTCDGSVDTGVSINSGTNLDRVYITVSADYSPMVTLIPINSRTITSSSARTILGYQDLQNLTSSSPKTPTSSVPTTPGTTVPSDTPTATITVTPTATGDGQLVTMTPLPSSTPTLVPTITPTATVTHTPTETMTPTLTFTPTITPTAMPGCDSITTGPLLVVSNIMSLSITNPHDPITVLNVQVVWNSVNGGAGSKPLALKSASLGGVFWAGTDSTGNLTIIPSTTVTIPGNNVTSAIMFTFDRTYQTKNGAESIVINLSTPGCEGYTIRKP